MNAFDKSLLETDISLGRLLDTIDGVRDMMPLIFSYDGRPVKGGNRVTEVKAGQFAALDCGAEHEGWSEIFVQLWDIDEDDHTHMPAGKFAAIISKVWEHLQLDGSAKLTFEVSDGVRPMQVYCAATPALHNGAMHVDLVPRPAGCKPRNRWLAPENQNAAACCGTTRQTGSCCS